MKKYKAFTLIELLIVVAIIAILAAIAVPNFLEAQTRAKVTRVKSDMRTVATALEAYFIDNNAYPPDNGNQTIGGVAIRRPVPGDPTTANLTFGYELTTPISYISNMEAAVDRFRMERADIRNNPVLNGRERFGFQNHYMRRSLGVPSFLSEEWFGNWAMYSAGPDRYWYHQGEDPPRDYSNWEVLIYDPTNGTVSYGDIWRSQKYNIGARGQSS